MFVKVKKKAPKEYYYQLILDFQACRIQFRNDEDLRFTIAMKNKKDERKNYERKEK